MAKIRRVIRKVDTPARLVIDEQFWPVMLALFVLCGFLMGTVAAYLPFGARRWWQDATTWLFVIPTATCASVWLLRFLPSQVVRRALQISILLGLLFHVFMLIVSIESRIFGNLWKPTARNQPRRPQRELRIVNNYLEHQLDYRQRQQQEFVRPVETAVPEPVPETVERQQERPEKPQVDPIPMPAPQTPREIQRNAIERPTPAETKPRESEQTSKLSRQRIESRPNPNDAIHVPIAAAPSAQASMLDARSEGLQQRPATTEANRMQTAPDPATTAIQNAPTIARRAAEQAPDTDTRSAPTLPRQLAQPSSAARVDTSTGETPSISQQTAPNELEPARTTTRQQLTASPRVAPLADPITTPQAAPVTGPSSQRDQPSPVQPQLAQTPIPVANRQSRATSRPDAASAAPTVAVNALPTADNGQSIEAAPSTVARTTTTSRAAPTAAGTTTTDAPSRSTTLSMTRRTATESPTPNLVAAAPTPRAVSAARSVLQAAAIPAPAQPTSSEEVAASFRDAATSLAGGRPGLQRPVSVGSAAGAAAGATTPVVPQAAPSIPTNGERTQTTVGTGGQPSTTMSNYLTRTARRSEAATSSTLADAPRTITADAGADQPQVRPSRLAMTQSLGGIAGVGQTPNLDRSPSTPGSPSTTASGSARRPQATQNTPPGPALAPSSAALVRRSLVGADRPSATMRASTTAVAEATGSEHPGELNATSSASLARQDANATPGEITASKGNVDIDLGPTRVADAGGFERASGGGQPEVNLDSASASLSRTRSGGSAPFALATTNVDISAASPVGGEQPAAGELAASSLDMKQVPNTGVGGSVAVKSDLQPSQNANADISDRIAASGMARTDAPADVPMVGEPAGGASADDGERATTSPSRALGNSPAPGGSLAGPVAMPTEAKAETEQSAADTAILLGADAGGRMLRQATNASSGPTGQAEQVVASAAPRGGNIVGEPTLQRAEATDALTGPAMSGGGTASQQRSASGRELATNVIADVTTTAGAPASSGSPRGIDAAARGGEPVPTATGALTRSTNNPAGAVASDLPRDAVPQSGMDVLAGLAPRSTVAGDTPAIDEAAVTAAPINRSGRTPVNAAPLTATIAGAPSAPMSVAVEDSELKEPTMGTGTSTARQQSAAALPIEVAAVDGAGGLGDRIALELGVNSRLATPESIEVQTTPARFVRQDIGGAPELNTSAVFATDAFRNRAPTRSNLPIGGGTGAAGPQTEESIELGLSYLARRQLSDGSWTLQSTTEPVQLSSDTAATGLCLLAFQGAGYSHREHRYASRIASGIEYLVKNQKPDGDLFVPLDDISNRSVWLYSHAIAAIALCEAYGMTHDPKLREPAQKALDFIIATQDPKGGGWRYQPQIESDTSVTGWMMMALKSGELASLKVPRTTYDQIGRWLDAAQGSANERYLYRYNPHAPNTDTQRHGRTTTPTMTAVGLLMRLYGGWRRDHPTMIAGAEHLQQNLPAIGTSREPLRDTYYWYYGTQVMFHMGGAQWEEWNGQLHPLLIESQIKQGEFAGSWSPSSPVPDRWSPHAGRLYVTTMNLLSLEVTYRHLPLYVDTAK